MQKFCACQGCFGLGLLALGNIPCGRIDQVSNWGCTPFQPSGRAVFTAVAVLEKKQFLLGCQGGNNLRVLFKSSGWTKSKNRVVMSSSRV